MSLNCTYVIIIYYTYFLFMCVHSRVSQPLHGGQRTTTEGSFLIEQCGAESGLKVMAGAYTLIHVSSPVL